MAHLAPPNLTQHQKVANVLEDMTGCCCLLGPSTRDRFMNFRIFLHFRKKYFGKKRCAPLTPPPPLPSQPLRPVLSVGVFEEVC